MYGNEGLISLWIRLHQCCMAGVLGAATCLVRYTPPSLSAAVTGLICCQRTRHDCRQYGNKVQAAGRCSTCLWILPNIVFVFVHAPNRSRLIVSFEHTKSNCVVCDSHSMDLHLQAQSQTTHTAHAHTRNKRRVCGRAHPPPPQGPPDLRKLPGEA